MKLISRSISKLAVASLFCAFSPVALSAYTGVCSTPSDVDELPPGHWCSVANSHATNAEKKPEEWDDWNGTSSAKYNSYQANMGFFAIMNNWCGAAFDSLRDRLLVVGGGHNGYGGNEIIAFSLKTLKWERITDPTPFPKSNNDGFYKNPGPPATPISRHTYGGLEYIESKDRLFMYGGAGYTLGWAIGGTWTFDLGAAANGDVSTNAQFWEERSQVGAPEPGLEDLALYDPQTDRVFYHRYSSPGQLRSYHYGSDTWSTHSTVGHLGSTYGVIIDGVIFEFNTRNGVNLRKWTIPSEPIGEMTYEDFQTGGDPTMDSASNPGIAYDTASGKIVGYIGGTDVYVYDIQDNTWSKYPAATTNSADPGPVTASGGIYGRFRYSKNLNTFVFVDSVNKNVFLYKLAPDPVKPSPPVLR